MAVFPDSGEDPLMTSHESLFRLRPVTHDFQAPNSKSTNFSACAAFLAWDPFNNYWQTLHEESISEKCFTLLNMTFNAILYIKLRYENDRVQRWVTFTVVLLQMHIQKPDPFHLWYNTLILVHRTIFASAGLSIHRPSIVLFSKWITTTPPTNFKTAGANLQPRMGSGSLHTGSGHLEFR